MQTYLSIDCDYFSVSREQPSKSAKILVDILNILQLPVYVTVGHDLHAFDVNRHKASRIINIDHHCDCNENVSEQTERFLRKHGTSLPLLARLTQLCEQSSYFDHLNEGNWIHYCSLHGTKQRVEHWYQTLNPGYVDKYYNDFISLVNGSASHYTCQVEQHDLIHLIAKRKNDIVAVGVAISPHWCEHLSYHEWGYDWGMEFFDTLHQSHEAFADRSLYSYYWANKAVFKPDNKCRKIEEYKMPYRKTLLANNVWYCPLRTYYPYYSLATNDGRVKIDAYKDCSVIPHLPSIKRAAEAFSQW